MILLGEENYNAISLLREDSGSYTGGRYPRGKTAEDTGKRYQGKDITKKILL